MSAYVPVELQRKIRTQFADCCAYCRTAEALTVVTFEIEHIHPQALGGRTTERNLCLACPTCNRFKADRTVAYDSVSAGDAPLFHPQQDDWRGHFAWADGGVEIVGLTATGRATIVALRMNRPQLVRIRRMWCILGEHPPKLP